MNEEKIELPKTIEDAMKLATDVLEAENSNFENTRKIIMSAFKNPAEGLSVKEIILVRLILIDANYSTQMGRRLFGLQDLADEIFDTCKDASIKDISDFDKKFDALLKDYIENITAEKHQIKQLFDKKYGLRKNGEEVGLARSLISKYCYYASNYNFPIEDSLVRNNINSVLNYFAKLEGKKGKILNFKKSKDLVKDLIILCKTYGYEFNNLDHLVWAYGKLAKGSLSIFVSREKFIEIIKQFKIKNSVNEAEEKIDNLVKRNLRNKEKLNQLKNDNLLTEELYKFITLCNLI